MPAGMVPMAQQPIMGSFEGCDNSQPTGAPGLQGLLGSRALGL